MSYSITFSMGQQFRWSRRLSKLLIKAASRGPDRGRISMNELMTLFHHAMKDQIGLALPYFIEEITRHHFTTGKGMLSIVVTETEQDILPYRGFFHHARRLGLAGSEEDIWRDQCRLVYGVHARPRNRRQRAE